MSPKLCPFCNARAQYRIFTAARVYSCGNIECPAYTVWMTLDMWNHRPEEQRLNQVAVNEELRRSTSESRVDALENWIGQTSQRIRLCAREIIGDRCECGFCDKSKEAK